MTADNKRPLISVIMPAYNAGEYIDDAIASVAGQTYDNWELIVVDDCSSDDTAQIAEKWVTRDARISLLTDSENKGVSWVRNKGIDSAKGEWIALLDSDDLWMPDKLEKQLALAEKTGAELVYCSYMLMAPQGETPFIVPEKTDYEDTLIKSVISCSTALMKTSVARRYPFQTGYYHEDYVLWISILRDGCSAWGCSEVLAKYRLRPNSRAANKWNSARHRWAVYRDYLQLPFHKSCRVFVQYALAGLKKYQKI